YGAMLDRLQPLILNYATEGGSWKEHNITAEQVYKRNQITLEKGPKAFKDLINFVVDDCVKKGYITSNN
ncbi:MAG: HD domain-containing protein, partial [Peptostreptococcaceae bacterium]